MTYKKKSYHSIVVPSKLAAATFLIEAVCSRPSPPFLSTHASFYSFLCISSGPDGARLKMEGPVGSCLPIFWRARPWSPVA
jgi:hypothetical protein